MGTVARQEKIGDSSIILSFENYQDFLDYQQKELEQDQAQSDKIKSFIDAFNAPKSAYRLELSEDEYYYLSCILGHLVPAGKISKSLLDKVNLDDLDCSDFDKVLLSTTEIKLNEENV